MFISEFHVIENHKNKIMKKIFLALTILITISAHAQWPWEKIDGNGQLKKENRNPGTFTEVASSGSWDVVIAYGSTCSVQVEADENLLPYIETSVESNRLNIKAKKNTNLRSKNRILIYVVLNKLTGLALSGSGDMKGEGRFDSDAPLRLRLSGSGNIKLSFEKSQSIELNIAGSGNIHLSGKADAMEASISGSGNADCAALTVNSANARISGSGNLKISVNKSIKASISGSGNVIYKGSADQVESHTAGSGRVTRG